MPRTALLALLLTAPAFAGTRSDAADEQALKAFRLTTENVRKATAVIRRLAVEAAKDPNIAKATEKDAKEMGSLDEVAKELEREPRVAAALRAERMTAREYLLVTLATIQASMVTMMKEQGVQVDTRKMVAELGVNPANLEFVEKHRREIEDLGRTHQELTNLTDKSESKAAPAQREGDGTDPSAESEDE